MIFFIYKTTNLANGMYYIGSCSRNKHEKYLGSGVLLKKAIKDFGRENFKREILEFCDDHKHMLDRETFWLHKTGASTDSTSYNIADKGHGGSSEKMREFWSNYTKDERKRLRNWAKIWLGTKGVNFGKKLSEETKKKIGAKSVGRNWCGPKSGIKGKLNPKAKVCRIVNSGILLYEGCLKEWCDLHPEFNYATMKRIAKQGLNWNKGPQTKKYQNLFIEYAG